MAISPVHSQTTLTRSLTKQLILQPIAMLDLEPDASAISFTLPAPAEAGAAPDLSGISDNSKWINYTSAVPPSTTRDITVAVTGGTVPPGLNLLLTVSSAAVSGGGTKGTPTSQVTVGATAQPCIQGIGGAFTGNGSNSGHQLTYTLDFGNFAQLYAVNTGNAVITYTLVDH
ncbi:MAG TPA: hypothetical protein P5550_09035 [Bacteroidales bacterium]|nr:hypothetical protein [Bacteroidales bacterium]